MAMPADAVSLNEDFLLRSVLERNPTLEQMRAATLAAQAKVAQATSLDDPSFGLSNAPGSLGSNNVNPAFRAELSQKLPWPGKRDLRGRMASAEASAVGRELEVARLELAEEAKRALADYYLAERLLAVNAESRELIVEFRKNAETRYRNGVAPQQDLLQADVEISTREEREIALGRARKLAQARLNTLMHLPPDSPLPAAPKELASAREELDANALRSRAIAARPDLKALADRIAGEEASAGLAEREYKPDVEVVAAYDGFWQNSDRPLQWQVGARLNIPIRYARRDGALTEAQARVAQRRAELARLSDQVALQVQEAYEEIVSARKIVDLYEQKLLPASQANVKEAQSAYSNGKIAFLNLVEAQRNLIDRRERQYEAIAELYKKRATLERVVAE